jgi:riboflavin kinase / FMN adenylyltransferase
MKIYSGFRDWPSGPRTAVTLGNFDGVHVGHQMILNRTVDLARSSQIPSVAVTFDPVPKKILQPETAPPLIQTLEQRLQKLERLGLEDVIVIKFNRPFAQKSPDEFVHEFLIERMKVKFFVVGEGFSFGHQKQGNLSLLRKMASRFDFEVHAIPEIREKGIRISSSQIRDYILQGNMEDACRFLGDPFTMVGIVAAGQQLGGKLGIPTANLITENEIMPVNGVYVCKAISSNVSYAAVTNIGIRPTFEGKKLTVEAHLLDFDGNLYGSRLELQFFHKLRDEKKFSGVDELKAQILEDIRQARSLTREDAQTR